MHDSWISKPSVIAYGLWSGAGVLLLLSSLAVILGHWRAAAILGLLTIMALAAAAVAHVRWGQIRLCTVVRTLHELEQPSPAPPPNITATPAANRERVRHLPGR